MQMSLLHMNTKNVSLVISLAAALLVGFCARCGAGDKDDLSCFMVLVGKNASADGSVLLAHNNDLTGDEVSLIEKHPRMRHPGNATVEFPSGLTIPQAQETFGWMVLRIEQGFAEGDAVAINEHQVAIAGGVALGSDRNARAAAADPLVKGGLTGGVRYVALQRCRTARECIETIGRWYTRYGVTYPSGFAAADTSEIWYIESGGGRSWAAVRIPDDCCWVQANGYRIGEIDPSGPDVLVSPGLLEFCRREGLWDPAGGPFSFRRAFGGGYIASSDKKYYNTRRIWRGISLLAPTLDPDPGLEEYPSCVVPDGPVALGTLFSILRDHYAGTPFDGYPEDVEGSGERLIASPGCVHTDVIELRAGMPAAVGAVLWAGLSMPQATTFIPFYFGAERVPQRYSNADPDRGAAFHLYREIAGMMLDDYTSKAPAVVSEWMEMESHIIAGRRGFEAAVLERWKKDPVAAAACLTAHTDSLAARALQKAEGLLDDFRRRE